jgi:hypothetical protein
VVIKRKLRPTKHASVRVAGTSLVDFVVSDRFNGLICSSFTKTKHCIMKQVSLFGPARTMVLTMLLTMLGFWAAAQESGGSGGASVNVSTTKATSTSSDGWYTSPWVWVVGAAVFILLLVALLNNRSSNKSAG